MRHSFSGTPLRSSGPRRKSQDFRLRSLLTQFKATEAPQDYILASFSNHPTYKVTDDDCIIFDPGLHHQYLLTQVLFQFFVNDLLLLLYANSLHRRVLRNLPSGLFIDYSRNIFIIDVPGDRMRPSNLQRQLARKFAEGFAACHKVCAAIQLQQYAYAVVVVDIGKDTALFRFTISHLHLFCFPITLRINDLERLIPVRSVVQGVFTISKCCASFLTQLFYICRHVVHNVSSSPQSYFCILLRW